MLRAWLGGEDCEHSQGEEEAEGPEEGEAGAEVGLRQGVSGGGDAARPLRLSTAGGGRCKLRGKLLPSGTTYQGGIQKTFFQFEKYFF